MVSDQPNPYKYLLVATNFRFRLKMQNFVLLEALIKTEQPDSLKKIIAQKLIKQVVEQPLDKK